MKKYSVSIIGASGYSGAELTRLLLHHPAAELEHLYAHSNAGTKVSDLYPAINTNRVYEPYDGESGSDLYFLAMPHGQALELVPPLLQQGKRVIDLSGDFRIKSTEEHLAYYKQQKPQGSILPYGLSELFPEPIRKAQAISNPGCYATSIILAAAPLFSSDSPFTVASINCVATSGISGAGRSSKTELSFSEMSENIRAYKVGEHQHTPEILQALGTSVTNPSFAFTFTPMIGSLVRGIYSVLTIQLDKESNAEALNRLYRQLYQAAPFVRIRENMPEVRHVAHTNFCDLHVASASGRTVIIISTLDNLLKGAAGQAIQNMNIMLELPEQTGLH